MSEHREEMIALAIRAWGEPTQKKPSEMRFGRNRSKKLDLTREEWHDKETDTGGGYPQLYKLVHGKLPTNGTNGAHSAQTRTSARPSPGPRQEPEWIECMMPPPRDSVAPTARQLECTTLYEYCNANDRLMFYVRRVEQGDGRKAFWPLTYGWRKDEDGRSTLGWHNAGPPSPRPLFMLNALAHAPDAVVLLCEGEKATQAAQRMFPNHVAMTWPGGTGGDRHADFSPLKGRDVILWPDADEAGVAAMLRIQEKLPQARMLSTEGLPPKYDAADLELDGDEPEAWLRERAPQPEPRDPLDDHQLPVIPWVDRRISDWREEELPDRLWVVPDWIPREQVTGLYGPPGVNKTDFLIQLMMATSAGLVFMGYQLERMPTFGLFCEDTDIEIARRAARMARHYGKSLSDFPDFHYASLVGFDDLEFVTFDKNAMYESKALKRFDKKIDETGAAFACLDTAPHFFGGSEIDRRQVSRFLRKLDAISIGRGCGILITAHPSARGQKSGRMESGSTGWEGGVRARIALTRVEEEAAEEGKPPSDGRDRRLTLWKSNYAPPGKMIDLVCDRGVFTTSALDPEKAKARGPLQREACQERFLELLRKTTEIGKRVHDSSSHPSNYAPLVFHTRDDGKIYSVAQYTRAMRDLEAAGRIRYMVKHNGKHMMEAPTQGSETQL